MFLEDNVRAKKPGGGWIEVICGSMFSGKTEELLRRLNRAKIANQRIEIFKPRIDTRYDDEEVVSHNKNSIRSTPVESSENILLLASDVDVVGIDEAQFFDTNLHNVCNELANQGIRVIVAGLDMDFQGNPFGPMPYVLAVAEYVTKVHAICVKTGKLANYSHRISGGSATIELGELDRYEPLSREAYISEKSKEVTSSESNE
ncbi:MAG: thymidine kinase [Flavobacteriales bacterium]|nr:thymidine kinase [Flavobacteriales bacterium]